MAAAAALFNQHTAAGQALTGKVASPQGKRILILHPEEVEQVAVVPGGL